MSVIGTAIPKRINGESQGLGPIAMSAGEKVALLSEVMGMLWGGTVMMRLLLLRRSGIVDSCCQLSPVTGHLPRTIERSC
eukprot:scaffold101141_cov72-Cyclotella_meneghiniana.AAC.1